MEGGREGGRVMEGGGESDGGREGEHWCSLTWACCCPCPIMGAGRRSHAVVLWAAIVVGGHLFLFLAVHFHWLAFTFVGGCSLLLVGDHFHRWAFVCTGGGSSSFIVVGCYHRFWSGVVKVLSVPPLFLLDSGHSCGFRWNSGGIYQPKFHSCHEIV